MSNAELERLVEEMVEVVHSDRNAYNARFWRPQPPWARGNWRGLPALLAGGPVPFVVEPDISLWAVILGLDIARFWSEPEAYLAGQLKMNLHKFRVFQDNTHFTGEVTPWPGVVFELSLFGIPVVWHEDRGPWIASEPVLKEYDDLDRLEMPDFYKSGLMPRVHEFYERFNEIVKGRLPVIFPDWVFGPFGVAMHLRGMQNLLMDTILNPEWVQRLLRFIVDAHKEWSKARAKFIGQPITNAKLYNDEIDGNVISPALYQDAILPYERELSDFHGGIVYFHSCGNLTKLLPVIRKLPDLEMLHISPWTDPGEALKLFAPEVAFDVCLDPVDDVIEASEEQMQSKLEYLVNSLRGKAAFSIRADAFQVMNDHPEDDYKKILRWCEIARLVTGQS
ncbi:Uroporphyrinogen decarboxylase (URO-D) [Moorella glycerini]|uniref:Methylcobalamin:coenzyme M methyltransferase n=1 Tax=Neomoorella stamsii TaxID=1266720 RepID=A0A9X7J2B2_9FIRM|nr:MULTISPECIES: uroporphyrinogen decarboxylase family protein [Moorella]PRR72352.1 methylcobalamin:coenzyme M methyltransferase [Moorella stamsii]CEP67361.1 Uroporphyrinogen decarboxylase (URO-D) [Moorella glycerini]